MAKEIRTDFLLDEDGDFPLEDNVVNGVYLDTPFGESDKQHIEDVIFFNIGHLKRRPIYDFGVIQYLNSEYNLEKIMKNLKGSLEKDDYEIKDGCVIPAIGGGFLIDTKFISRK
jgi:hypothetical protein